MNTTTALPGMDDLVTSWVASATAPGVGMTRAGDAPTASASRPSSGALGACVLGGAAGVGSSGPVGKEMIDRAESSGVAIYAPQPTGKDGEPCVEGRRDPSGVTAWRRRMTTPEGQKIYKERAATSETVNAQTKTYRGLGRFLVRGLNKVRCIALGSALAYNVVHFADDLSG